MVPGARGGRRRVAGGEDAARGARLDTLRAVRGHRGHALDPLPEMLEDGTVALVEVGRERFLARLLEMPRPGPALRALKGV